MCPPPKNSRLVYSTDQGRIKTNESDNQPQAPSDGIIRIARETKGRKGKGVSLITGIAPSQIKDTAKQLKQALGVGGAVKDGVIEIQSDNRTKLKQLLEAQGHKVKIAGG